MTYFLLLPEKNYLHVKPYILYEENKNINVKIICYYNLICLFQWAHSVCPEVLKIYIKNENNDVIKQIETFNIDNIANTLISYIDPKKVLIDILESIKTKEEYNILFCPPTCSSLWQTSIYDSISEFPNVSFVIFDTLHKNFKTLPNNRVIHYNLNLNFLNNIHKSNNNEDNTIKITINTIRERMFILVDSLKDNMTQKVNLYINHNEEFLDQINPIQTLTEFSNIVLSNLSREHILLQTKKILYQFCPFLNEESHLKHADIILSIIDDNPKQIYFIMQKLIMKLINIIEEINIFNNSTFDNIFITYLEELYYILCDKELPKQILNVLDTTYIYNSMHFLSFYFIYSFNKTNRNYNCLHNEILRSNNILYTININTETDDSVMNYIELFFANESLKSRFSYVDRKKNIQVKNTNFKDLKLCSSFTYKNNFIFENLKNKKVIKTSLLYAIQSAGNILIKEFFKIKNNTKNIKDNKEIYYDLILKNFQISKNNIELISLECNSFEYSNMNNCTMTVNVENNDFLLFTKNKMNYMVPVMDGETNFNINEISNILAYLYNKKFNNVIHYSLFRNISEENKLKQLSINIKHGFILQQQLNENINCLFSYL